jgi:hypothetical protein
MDVGAPAFSGCLSQGAVEILEVHPSYPVFLQLLREYVDALENWSVPDGLLSSGGT